MRCNKAFALIVAVIMLYLTSVTALAANITISVSGGGTVSVKDSSGAAVTNASTVADGESLTVTASPSTGYWLKSLTAAGASISSGATVTATGATNISAVFTNKPVLTYGVSGNRGGTILVVDSGGSPVLSGSEVDAGEVLTVRNSPGSSYTYSGFRVSGGIDMLSGEQFKVYDNATAVSVTGYFTYTGVVEDEDDEEDDDDAKTAAAKPYVIINSYSYGGGSLVAGEICELTMTFYNTSKSLAVENMKVTMGMPEALMLTSSSNSFYIESLKAGGSISKTVLVTAKPTAAPQSHEISVDFNYDYIDDKVRKSNETSENISIPVVQVDRFELSGVELESEIIAGEESVLTVNFVNKGRSDVYNISASISGNIQNPGQQQNLGNLASGATGSADFYIGALEAGNVSGEVTITYEDTNMTQKTVTIPYASTAISYEDPGMFDPTLDPNYDPSFDPNAMPEEKSGPNWWLIGGGVAAVAVVGGLLLRRRKLKKLMETEDEDI